MHKSDLRDKKKASVDYAARLDNLRGTL